MTRPPFFAPGVIECHRAPVRPYLRYLRHLLWALARVALVLLIMAALWRWL